MAAMSDTSSLRRSVSLPFLVLYGVGTMVGGGFYALLGKITGDAGSATPLAFLLSGLLALLSACAFAEMASRHPVSARSPGARRCLNPDNWHGSLRNWRYSVQLQ